VQGKGKSVRHGGAGLYFGLISHLFDLIGTSLMPPVRLQFAGREGSAMRDFRDRKAYVVGGSSGIGLSLCRELASRGAHLVILARGRERLEKALEEVSALRVSGSQKAAVVSMDVSSWPEVLAGMEKAVRDFGAPDILVNSAGRALPGRFLDLGIAQFEEIMGVNLMGTIHTVKALVPSMKERGGVIVNISSVAGLVGVYGYTDYSASKYAVIGFSEALRSELKPLGIKVQVLCPPDTDTPCLERENLTKPEETRRIASAAKVMTPDEVARELVRGMGTNRFLIIPGFDSKMAVLAKRLFPGLVEWVMDRLIAGVSR
jgi:3-dehydrosphinganine reductase